MKSIKVILDVTIEPDSYQEFLDKGYEKPQILNYIESCVDGARISCKLIHDFQVCEIKGEI